MRDFKAILREKMGTLPSENTSFSEESSSFSLSFELFAELKSPDFRGKLGFQRTPYKHIVTAKPEPPPLRPLPPLSSEEKAAYDFFVFEGYLVKLDSRQSLKQAFRKLAKRFHPDSKHYVNHCTKSHKFMELHKNYKILELYIQKIS